MKKIAIPVTDKVLSAHFGHCEKFYVYDIENEKVENETLLTPPPHEPGLLPKWLGEQAVTDIIAGGIGQRAIDLFKINNINVFVGAPQVSPKEIVESHLNGSLTLKGNYCDH
jgi:predicted Fe-Mo cluster-binding NifX family protein